LEESGKPIFIHVTGELDRGISRVLFLQRLNIPSRLRMISPADYELGVRQRFTHDRECLDHQLKPLVRSPFSKCQNAVLGITAPGKIGILRAPCQHPMRSEVNIGSAIFFVQDLAVARHEHRNRIREQEHARGHRSGQSVKARMAHARIFQIDGVHQVMQGDMRVTPANAREQRSK
jgi:hypothetical protein